MKFIPRLTALLAWIFMPALALGQVNMGKGFALLQEGSRPWGGSESYSLWAMDATMGGGGQFVKIFSIGTLNPSQGLRDMTVPGKLRHYGGAFMGALRQVVFLENPGKAYPTVFMIQKRSDALFSLAAGTGGTPALSMLNTMQRHMTPISHTQALAMGEGGEIYLLNNDGTAKLVMAENWFQGLGVGSPRVFTALEVTSANPLQGKFAMASATGDLAIIELDATKNGSDQHRVLMQTRIRTDLRPSHLLVGQNQMVLIGDADPYGPRSQGEAIYFDMSLNVIDLFYLKFSASNNGIKGIVRGMPLYASTKPAEVYGLSRSTFNGFEIIEARDGAYHSTLRKVNALSLDTQNSTPLFNSSHFSPHFDAGHGDDIIADFPPENLPQSLPDHSVAVGVTSVSTGATAGPDWGAFMNGITAGLAATAGRVVDGTMPANLTEWDQFLANERTETCGAAAPVTLTTGSRPTMREFVAFANRSPRLLPLLVNTLDFRDRLRFGFFWESPGIRARYPFTVDTDRVNLAELLALITARAASCEKNLKPKPRSP